MCVTSTSGTPATVGVATAVPSQLPTSIRSFASTHPTFALPSTPVTFPRSTPTSPVAATSIDLPEVVGYARSSTCRAVVCRFTVRSHHSPPAASLNVTWILSPFISAALRFTLTRLLPAGLTLGSVARFASAPPSIDTFASPAARVGAA